MRSFPRQAVLLLFAAVAATAGFAQPASRLVRLEATGSPEDVEALRSSLQDWLRSLELELELSSAATPPGSAFATVRVQWNETDCVVEVFGPSGALTRRKVLPRGGPPLLISESAALIAQAGLQELKVEARRRQPLPVADAAVPALVVAPPEPAGLGLALGVFGQGRALDEASPFVLGAGLEVSAVWGDAAWRPGVSLLASYQGPVLRESSLARLVFQSVSLRLVPGVRRKLGAFEVEGGLGGGLDLLIANTTSNEVPRHFVRREGVDAAPFFTALVGLRWQATASLWVFARAVLDVDPARRRYVTSVAGEREYLLVPWAFRPAVQVGLSFDLLGGGR